MNLLYIHHGNGVIYIKEVICIRQIKAFAFLGVLSIHSFLMGGGSPLSTMPDEHDLFLARNLSLLSVMKEIDQLSHVKCFFSCCPINKFPNEIEIFLDEIYEILT